MSEIYFYKVRYDTGAAPCVHGEHLSLAICKPAIRMTAREGDLLFGFAASALEADNKLIFAAKVTEAIDARKYATEARFAERPDRIYRWDGKIFSLRRDARYHLEDGALEHDLGQAPSYGRARVLLSGKYRYFGESNAPNYKRAFPAIKRAVEALTQGHRVNHAPELESELRELYDQVMRSAPTPSAPPAGSPVRKKESGCSAVAAPRIRPSWGCRAKD